MITRKQLTELLKKADKDPDEGDLEVLVRVEGQSLSTYPKHIFVDEDGGVQIIVSKTWPALEQ